MENPSRSWSVLKVKKEANQNVCQESYKINSISDELIQNHPEAETSAGKDEDEEWNTDATSISSDSNTDDEEAEEAGDDNDQTGDASPKKKITKLDKYLTSLNSSGEPYSCTLCKKTYKIRKNLQRHVRRVHESAPKYSCDLCGKLFSLKYRYRRHLNVVHGKVDNPRYTCSFEGCGKLFMDKYLLDLHESGHKPPELKCDICGKMYRLSKHLNRHRKTHDNTRREKRFPCLICTRAYVWPEDLKRHMKVKHSPPGEQPEPPKEKKKQTGDGFPCPTCGKIFFEQYRLNRHLSTVHAAREHSKFTCTFEGCGKLFPEKSILERHKITHLPPQEACHICGKLFKSKMNLEVHLKRHASKGQRNFFCDQCPNAYAFHADLLQHVKLKHPLTLGRKVETYSCQHCGEVRSDSRALRNHVRRVHEKKQVCCEVCGKMILNNHMRHHMEAMHSAHRETKPHKCEVCGKGFSRREYLRGHSKIHLPKDQQPRRRQKGGAKERAETDYERVVNGVDMQSNFEGQGTKLELDGRMVVLGSSGYYGERADSQ